MNKHLPKQKISIVLRDQNEVPHRKGINSLAMVNDYQQSSQVNFFSASRDRLIKLWSVNYKATGGGTRPEMINTGGPPVSLLANLDGHTDWVNQIHWIPEI